MKPLSELDTSVIKVAANNAYCSSSRLKPFRDEDMPARWLYVDTNDEVFEVETSTAECVTLISLHLCNLSICCTQLNLSFSNDSAFPH